MTKPPKTITPEKPPGPLEATIFSKALRGEKLTRTEEQTLGGRGMSELAAAAKEHSKTRAEAEKAVVKAEKAQSKVQKAVTKAQAKPPPKVKR